MSKYIISVHEISPAPDAGTTTATQEIFKLGVDEFDPLTFCAALKKRRARGPAARKAVQS